MPAPTFNSINRRITRCDRCPRLREHCRNVAETKRRAYETETYWGKPVPNFGDPNARLLVVGLAPGAHGANRTGRMFTGDRSGDWLYRALARAGFANQPESTSRKDGLKLIDCCITGVCHCAPPDNKPTTEEVSNCADWLRLSIGVMPVRVFLALGGLAWNATIDFAREEGLWTDKRPKFGHAAEVEFESEQRLLGSYHPSQQNTFTGRLTESMLDSVFARANELLEG